MNLAYEHADDPNCGSAWPAADTDLLAKGEDWWLVACMDWPRDRWIGYVRGYWKAATLIAEQVAVTGRDQDYLVYPFLMCWRHYVELQLKALILLARTYRRETAGLPLTHKIDQLWRVARPLIQDAFPSDSQDPLDNTERVLLQLNSFDPTSEHFRYPVQRDGSETLSTLGRVHIHRFHEAMEAVANLLDSLDIGIRVMIDQRNEYEEAMRELYDS